MDHKYKDVFIVRPAIVQELAQWLAGQVHNAPNGHTSHPYGHAFGQ
jgi:hypothetical protein